ncbi:MAG: glycosyltransferase family 4 protein [Egibacteraceae bacterium]
MRIAIVAPPWIPVPPAGFGGIERALDGLCQGLAADGHQVLLFATGDSTCPVETMWEFEYAVGTEMSPVMELHHVLAAYAVLQRWKPDIVHDHTLLGPFIAGDHPELAVVTTSHQPFEGSFGYLYRSLTNRVPVIAISHSQAAMAKRPIAAVIHYGIDVSSFPIGSGQGGYGLFLGRMSLRKGVDTAIRVARAAGIPLRIAAKMREHSERRYFAERIEPLLGGDIEYIGEAKGAAKLGLIGEAIFLLNPIAWAEPFGMVMIEALACGTPVVTRPCGAAPEIIEDGRTGFLRRDEASLARAVENIQTIRRINCRTVAEQRFSLQQFVTAHLAVYDKIVKG